MSISEREKDSDSASNKSKGKSKINDQPKGIRSMLRKDSDEDHEQISQGVDDEDDDEEEDWRDRKVKKAKEKAQKRNTSKTRFVPFRSSNKIGNKLKDYKQQKLSDDEDSDYEAAQVRKENMNKSVSKNEVLMKQYDNDLTSSKSRYAKLAEKALHEMSQFTSEDEDIMIQKKRQHLVNSLKKEYPRQSHRLENML